MGYKIAGFDVLGCNEIDPKMIEAYKVNHNPKYAYLEPIQTFKLRKDLPKELYNLDILDGSPPCSSFSMAGNREKDWGKDKKFREGQAEQVLDTLFFDFIDLAKELQPKIVVAENVKGLLMGKAKEYVGEIGKAFEEAGYYVDKWLLDASKMGVPQRRERVFFVAIRKDLVDLIPGWIDMFNPMPKLDLEFNEAGINYSFIREESKPTKELHLTVKGLWEKCSPGFNFGTVHKKGHYFGETKMHPDKVCPTVIANQSGSNLYDNIYPRILTDSEYCKVGTYPLDYNFLDNKPKYLIGMSVPPVMTAQIATEIYNQWISKL
jgi:DNA (cytosine-5)-methyltransferase 1